MSTCKTSKQVENDDRHALCMIRPPKVCPSNLSIDPKMLIPHLTIGNRCIGECRGGDFVDIVEGGMYLAFRGTYHDPKVHQTKPKNFPDHNVSVHPSFGTDT